MNDTTKQTALPSHTPGPWRIGSHPWNIVAESGLVASAQFRGYTPTALERAEVDANARLIAAAPDLLEACLRTMAALEGGEDLCEGHVCIAFLRKAVRLARGQ